MSSVTVVVPTCNSARTIEACLRSVRRQTHPCTVVVVDNHSTDATVTLARPLADVTHQEGPERSAQRNIGARLHPADIIGFVDSDMVLSADVVSQAVAAISRGAVGVIVPERTIGDGFWTRVRAFERSFYDGADNVEAARFYSWAAFNRTGGFDEELTGAEDIDLTRRARLIGPIDRIAAIIDHDEGRVRYIAACRKKAYYATGVARYMTKYGNATAAREWARRPWARQPRRLLSPEGLGLLTLKAGELLAVTGALLHNRRSHAAK